MLKEALLPQDCLQLLDLPAEVCQTRLLSHGKCAANGFFHDGIESAPPPLAFTLRKAAPHSVKTTPTVPLDVIGEISGLAEGAGTSGSIARAVYWRSVRVQSGTPLASQSGGSSQTVASALPTVRDAIIRQSATGLTLPSGASLYLYGMATGGAAPSRGFSSGPYAQVMDAAGAVADALAATSSNSNSYATDTGFHVIGGVAVSGFSHYKATYGSDGTWGTNSASDTFAIPHKSLVVVIGLASSQQSIRLDGIPSLKTDALSSGAGATLGMIIAHAYLGPGEYTVTENSGALAGGQNPNHMADLVGVFVFQ